MWFWLYTPVKETAGEDGQRNLALSPNVCVVAAE